MVETVSMLVVVVSGVAAVEMYVLIVDASLGVVRTILVTTFVTSFVVTGVGAVIVVVCVELKVVMVEVMNVFVLVHITCVVKLAF